MFGLLSLPKILFTVGIVLAVWYGFKWLNRQQQLREDHRNVPRKKAPKAEDVEEMVLCPDCKAYVPAQGRHTCIKGN